MTYYGDYLLDASAFWRIVREPETAALWADSIQEGVVRLCDATRTEILYSAEGPAHRDRMERLIAESFPPAPVPKNVWAWVDTTQYKLTLAGQHRAAGVVDLVVAATSSYHDLTILHDDRDFETVARVLPDVQQERIITD